MWNKGLGNSCACVKILSIGLGTPTVGVQLYWGCLAHWWVRLDQRPKQCYENSC